MVLGMKLCVFYKLCKFIYFTDVKSMGTAESWSLEEIVIKITSSSSQ